MDPQAQHDPPHQEHPPGGPPGPPVRALRQPPQEHGLPQQAHAGPSRDFQDQAPLEEWASREDNFSSWVAVLWTSLENLILYFIFNI